MNDWIWWKRTLNWSGASDDLIKHHVTTIQRDALLEAAEIAKSDAVKCYGSREYNMGLEAVHDAILERSREI